MVLPGYGGDKKKKIELRSVLFFMRNLVYALGSVVKGAENLSIRALLFSG